MKPYVFRTTPLLVEKVWGGRALEDWGKTLPTNSRYGESWEVADLPEGQSKIADGPMRGATLRKAVEAWGADLIGTKATESVFPLLVKILDANADLSVQVHPGQNDVASLPGARSKDEAWLILKSDNGSILHGFCEGIDESRFRVAVAEGHAERVIRRVAVQPGELYRVAPGTVHAICSGVQLLEIQQPSDTTFRVWDYERPGLDGNLRPLHLEQAYSVMRYDADPAPTAHLGDAACTPLLATAHYSIASWELQPEERTWQFDNTSPTVVFALEGEATVGGCSIVRGQTAVVPACVTEVTASGHGTVVVARA